MYLLIDTDGDRLIFDGLEDVKKTVIRQIKQLYEMEDLIFIKEKQITDFFDNGMRLEDEPYLMDSYLSDYITLYKIEKQLV